MPKYAESTTVPPERSQAEIRSLVNKYGATAFAFAEQQSAAYIGFEMYKRQVRFVLPLPNPSDHRVKSDGQKMTDKQAEQSYEKEVRRRWRALTLCIKAKLEAVSSEIVTFEEEFLAQIVVADAQGRHITVGEWLRPQLEETYESGVPPMLPALPGIGET